MSQLNYTQKSTEVLQTAQATATEYGSPQVEQCHLLYALIADPQGLSSQLLEQTGVTMASFRAAVKQEVEIYFNFVGRFVPPAFGEAELTPEELEEIRKREERKDKLHQNYLKRKASGAQKRYEDKIKERKKAEIEDKKAAIRAEDIAKGVFVPVSSLPQREPQKGAQIA